MRKRIRRDGRLTGYVSLHRIKVGADPEFELIEETTGIVRRADGVITGGTNSNDQIGVDGAGSPVEFRPTPAERPQTAVKEFKRLVKSFARYYPGYKLSYAGNTHAVGGHIHVSVDEHRFTDTQMRHLAVIFDDFIGKFVLPLSGSARGCYAQLGSWRQKPWGMEYRVPPAACFSSPTFLRLMYKGIKELTFRYMNQATMNYETTPRPTDHDYRKYARFSATELATLFSEIDRCKNETRDSKDLLAHWSIQMREARTRRHRGGCRDISPDEREYQRRMELERTANAQRARARQEREALRRVTCGNVSVVYGDDWSDANMRSLTTHISVQCERVTGNERFNIELFGLAASRGEVATIDIPMTMTGWGMVDDVTIQTLRAGWTDRFTLRIGLPLIFRTITNDLHATVARAIVDAVVNHIVEIA